MQDYQKETIDTYNAKAQVYKQTRGGLMMTKQIQTFLGYVQGKKILEIGSAVGRDAREFIDAGYDYLGVDMSEGLLEVAREHVPEAEFILADVLALPFSDNEFGGIWCCATLLHLKREDMPQALAQIHRVLKPGGAAYVSVKKGVGEENKEEKQFDSLHRFFTYYKEEELEGLCRSAGFEVLDMDVNNSFETFGERANNPEQDFINIYLRKPQNT